MPLIARTWNPPAALNALKTTLGVIVAWGIVLRQQLPDPFLAPVAVLFLQTPYLGASLHKGLMPRKQLPPDGLRPALAGRIPGHPARAPA
ncbi:MAG: hypothetical protein KFB96_11095 [Thiocapsa sp.]|uniref:hypothetical protein n=1 Tax=Thiocapsa sp. TaxID=2024551 RepID=UPI001BD045AB|nr:hypothetical protein [Thiocapsa sp.]QVL50894.1 MAG: hypothetical protein KFB96_11095 [Thiocapsa sp.]